MTLERIELCFCGALFYFVLILLDIHKVFLHFNLLPLSVFLPLCFIYRVISCSMNWVKLSVVVIAVALIVVF
jgi:hypothetical protein